jgi:hypothetical protein
MMMNNTICTLHYQSDQQKDMMEHVACIGKQIYSALWLGNHKERQNLGDQGTDGWIVLQ